MFNYITTFHLNATEERWEDFLFCLTRNNKNPVINNIYILADLSEDKDNPKLYDRLLYISTLSKNIHVKTIIGRITFKALFLFCNQIPGKWIISNGDMYFPESNADKLKLLLNKDYNKECFVLSRYNKMKRPIEGQRSVEIDGEEYVRQHDGTTIEGASIDSWIFETPFDLSQINLDILLGKPFCDGFMNHELSKVKQVSNPCLSVVSIHKHTNWRNWYEFIDYHGEIVASHVYLRRMKRNDGFNLRNIPFTKLPEDQ